MTDTRIIPDQTPYLDGLQTMDAHMVLLQGRAISV